MPRVGVIGGSGLYDMALDNRQDLGWATQGEIDGAEVVFVARHGRGHRFNPSAVKYKENIRLLKEAGVQWIISVSAVGSLDERIEPGHVVTPKQFIDRTKRHLTFFDHPGSVGHVPFGHPICERMSFVMATVMLGLKGANEIPRYWSDGTYVCIEGPMFSTMAESKLYQSWGAQVVGMTNMTEARLAREAGMSYYTLAMVTDFDCWHPDHDSVTVEQVMATMKGNVTTAQKIIRKAVPLLATLEDSPHKDVPRQSLMGEAIAEMAWMLG